MLIALVDPLVLQGPTLCPFYLPLSYQDRICLCPTNLQCSNNLLLNGSRYSGSGLIFSVALPPFLAEAVLLSVSLEIY